MAGREGIKTIKQRSKYAEKNEAKRSRRVTFVEILVHGLYLNATKVLVGVVRRVQRGPHLPHSLPHLWTIK